MHKYYLYRWIRLDKNEPFYIGIGTKTIADIKYGTYNRAFTHKKQNSIWKKIIDKSEYKVEILFESDDYDFIKQKEIEFILLYGRIDLKSGCLANMTDGGEGTKNVIVSEYSRQLRRDFHTGRKKSKESINKQIATRKLNGFKLSDAAKRKISISKSKSVLQYSLKGKLIKEWNTVVEASEELNIPKTSIVQSANFNERKIFTAFNYIWLYKEDYSSNNLEKFYIAIERSKLGKIKKFITIEQKKDIINDYLDILIKFDKKIDRLNYLSTKYNMNYSTVRAIVS
jgi:hypothetical protein